MKQIALFIVLCVIFSSPVSAQMSQTEMVRITLQQAIDEALANSDLLKKSESEVGSALAVVEEAKGAFLPSVNAGFDYNYLDIIPGFKSVILGNIKHDLFPRLAVTQPLFAGGRLKQARESAVAALESKQYDLKDDRLNIKLGVTILYYRLLSVDNEIKILQENRRQLETTHQYSRLLVQAGRMSELELNRLEVEMANIDSQILKAHNDYLLASNDLSVLLGRDSPATFIPQEELSLEPLPLRQEDFLETAFEKNPVWAKFQWDVKQAESRVLIQKSARLPQISATVWYGYEFGLESFSFGKNDRFFVGISAQMPLFSGGVIDARIALAESQLEQLKLQQEYFRKALEAQVRNLSLRLDEMKQRIEVQKKAVEQAEKSHRLALIEYQAGRRSNTDLLDIQKSLLNSQLQLNKAVVEYNNVKAQLLFVLGIL